MCIDKQTLTDYKNNTSAFHPTLKNGINFKKSKFKTDKNGRCAFLNEKGLCEIIINLGEKSLCQVCRDHPRYRTFFNDRIEMGLGFSCEQASSVILSFTEKIVPLLISEDGENTSLDFNQQNVIGFRNKALDILQDRTTDINDRIKHLLTLCNASFLVDDDKRIIKTFLSFERLDKSWTSKLKMLKKKPLIKEISLAHSLYCEQFLVNSVYRHLYDAEDTMWVRAKTIACVISWWIIQSILAHSNPENSAQFDLIVDTVRAFSSEVEYSKNNINKLHDFCYKFIKI